ncbi:zinc metallochaperone AztD [Cellulomonas endophytica]|uniref:zinc metallochaperone AztD n=1 Tax=Cellulomonas endophytica TaxID=2494735 RepID=UPI00196B5E16|nr:zinc metallochaperone AztD [Cellulomonas endophytica]
MPVTRPRRPLAAAAALPLVLLAACGTSEAGGSASASASATTEDGESTPSGATEAAASSPRLAISYDGGVQVVDGTTLEVLADERLEGFVRLNPAGDGRHLLVTAQGGWHVLDGGAWEETHGDHSHFYTAEPGLTGTVFPAEEPAHVVTHAGRTVLFDDGTGDVTSFSSAEIEDEDRELRTYTTPAVHHGVAVELSDGRMVVSEGTEEGRTGIRVLDEDDQEIAADDRCPDVHGETVAAEETVVIGCTDGVLVYRDGTITKVQSPDVYGRIGNQFGTEDSPVVLGDYKADPDAEIDLTTRVSLIDTRTATLRLVDLPSSYWYRSLGRGENGEGVVLGTDGSLHVIDTEAGTVARSVPVIDAWEVSENWQDPQPQVFTLEGTAYITDPAGRAIHAVDIETGEIWASADLDVVPNELSGVTGEADEHAGHDHG